MGFGQGTSFDHLNLVTVNGQALTLDQQAARGKVTFTSSTMLTDLTSGQAIFPVPLTVALDGSGAFTIDLPATDDPDLRPVGWVYQVLVDVQGSAADAFTLALPVGTVGAVDLFLAAPVSGSGVVYVPQQYGPTSSADELFAFALMGVF